MTIKVQVYDSDGNEILVGGENPTGDLRAPTAWETGRKYSTQQLGRSVAGSASLRLLNIGSKWSGITRGNRVLISVNDVVQWGGYVDHARNRYVRHRIYRQLECFGALALLRKRISIPTATDVSVQDAMTSIFDACNVPTVFRGSVSGTLIIPSFGADDEDGKAVAHKLENSAQGFLHEFLDGSIAMGDTTGTPPISRAIANITSEDFDDTFERDVDGYFTTPANSNTVYQLARAGLTSPFYEEAPEHFLTSESAIDTYMSWLLLSQQFGTEIGTWRWFAANDMSLLTGLGLRDRLTYRGDLIYIVEAKRVRLQLGGKYETYLTVARFNVLVIAPGAPQNTRVILSSSTFIQWAWDPSSTGDPPTLYQMEWRLVGTSDWTLITGVDSPYTLTGLTGGTEYEVRLRARNQGGDSAWTDPPTQGETNLVPSVPTSVFGSRVGSKGVRFVWSAPVFGDPPITIEVQRRESTADDWRDVPDPVSPITFQGAESSTYYFQVRATNQYGSSAWVGKSVSIPQITFVSAGLGSVATSANFDSITLTWAGVQRVEGYRVTGPGGGTTTGQSWTFSGLEPSTSYSGSVTPYNEHGNGSGSSWSATTPAQ